MLFFKPNENFWKWADKTLPKDKLVMDIGCGQGHVIRGFLERGFKACGCDPSYRIFNEMPPLDLVSCVFPLAVEDVKMVRTLPMSLLTCRPCHSRFTLKIPELKHPESVFYYVGLQKNLDLDLSGRKFKRIKTPRVGEDGEQIYLVS